MRGPESMAARAGAVRARRHDDARLGAARRDRLEWFLLLTAFVGVNQWLYVAFGACPASIVLRRACQLRSAIYQNPERTTARRERWRSDVEICDAPTVGELRRRAGASPGCPRDRAAGVFEDPRNRAC